MYGVLTWGRRMPAGFPLDTPQNSGNMVHAEAPFRLFPNAIGSDWGYKEAGYPTFADFVNSNCKALIIPFANSIREGSDYDAKGYRHIEALSKFTVPIVPFGIGAQSASTNVGAFNLGPGMISFLRFLSDRAPAISVRGEFTREVFAKYATTDNVHVTGCPSFFSRPEAFSELKAALDTPPERPQLAFAGSLHHLPTSKLQLYRAIKEDLYLIEPVNAKLHQFYLDCINGRDPLTPAYFLKGLLKEAGWDIYRLRDYMIRRYRLFRDLDSWQAFYREAVDGTLGSRFHVNMASILSGVPALWFVHDSRTAELCETLSLPRITVGDSPSPSYRELFQRVDFNPMFNNLGANFSRFTDFLRDARLPAPAVLPV